MQEKFVVNAIRQLVVNDKESYCELVSFLVDATSIEQAQQSIEEHLRSNEQPQTNASGDIFLWRFVETDSVNPIVFEDGKITELQVKVYDTLDDLYEAIE